VKERGKKNKKPQSIRFGWGFFLVFFWHFLIKFKNDLKKCTVKWVIRNGIENKRL